MNIIPSQQRDQARRDATLLRQVQEKELNTNAPRDKRYEGRLRAAVMRNKVKEVERAAANAGY